MSSWSAGWSRLVQVVASQVELTLSGSCLNENWVMVSRHRMPRQHFRQDLMGYDRGHCGFAWDWVVQLAGVWAYRCYSGPLLKPMVTWRNSCVLWAFWSGRIVLLCATYPRTPWHLCLLLGHRYWTLFNIVSKTNFSQTTGSLFHKRLPLDQYLTGLVLATS